MPTANRVDFKNPCSTRSPCWAAVTPGCESLKTDPVEPDTWHKTTTITITSGIPRRARLSKTPSPPLCPMTKETLKRKVRNAQIDLMSILLSYVLVCWGILLICLCVFVVGVSWTTHISISHGLIFIKVAFWSVRPMSVPTREPFPIPSPFSLPLHFLSALICPIII